MVRLQSQYVLPHSQLRILRCALWGVCQLLWLHSHHSHQRIQASQPPHTCSTSVLLHLGLFRFPFRSPSCCSARVDDMNKAASTLPAPPTLALMTVLEKQLFSFRNVSHGRDQSCIWIPVHVAAWRRCMIDHLWPPASDVNVRRSAVDTDAEDASTIRSRRPSKCTRQYTQHRPCRYSSVHRITPRSPMSFHRSTTIQPFASASREAAVELSAKQRRKRDRTAARRCTAQIVQQCQHPGPQFCLTAF